MCLSEHLIKSVFLCVMKPVCQAEVPDKSGNAKNLLLHLKYGLLPSIKREQITKYFMITCKSLAKALFQPIHFHVTIHADDAEMVLGSLFQVSRNCVLP